MVHRNQVGSIRLIPAHAGKTSGRSEAPLQRATHPRSREENIDAWQLPERHVGSPPLARGKPQQGRESSDCARLIPAHAGKTSFRGRTSRLCPVHPRSRGENEFGWPLPDLTSGSSPLTRGKPAHYYEGREKSRLIPAHAGKTAARSVTATRSAAHPRSRGENATSGQSWGLGVGSSPLTRGKPRPGRIPGPPPRLIPAHAGKTTPGPRYARPWRAHPRSRGENARRSAANDVYGGSSPLTRGKLGLGREASAGHGLIPAHAGKTRRSSR